jgi:hypothetical protein
MVEINGLFTPSDVAMVAASDLDCSYKTSLVILLRATVCPVFLLHDSGQCGFGLAGVAAGSGLKALV